METGNVSSDRPISVSEHLLNEIRNQIASGSFDSNHQLPTEMELARQFNVSRASVREAIKTLNYLGIVESCTSRGTRITSKTRLFEKAVEWSVVLGCEDFRDAFVLGTALDTQVAIIAAEKIHHDRARHTEFYDRFIGILTGMATAAINKDLPVFRNYFSEYFYELYGFSQNSIFISLNECINSLITEKVCEAYFVTGAMLEVVSYFNSAWNAIYNYKTNEAVDVFQAYGAFAYDTVTKYAELPAD